MEKQNYALLKYFIQNVLMRSVFLLLLPDLKVLFNDRTRESYTKGID